LVAKAKGSFFRAEAIALTSLVFTHTLVRLLLQHFPQEVHENFKPDESHGLSMLL
jgi:hypothetical protein